GRRSAAEAAGHGLIRRADRPGIAGSQRPRSDLISSINVLAWPGHLNRWTFSPPASSKQNARRSHRPGREPTGAFLWDSIVLWPTRGWLPRRRAPPGSERFAPADWSYHPETSGRNPG